jgi:hypothetical protein
VRDAENCQSCQHRAGLLDSGGGEVVHFDSGAAGVGIRETLNENRAVSVGAAIGVIVLALIWIASQVMSFGPSETPRPAPSNAPPSTQSDQ